MRNFLLWGSAATALLLVALAITAIGAFRRRRARTAPDERLALSLVQSGCQYYATARFAMRAQCVLVFGNLFHHAVEMMLKGGLAKKGMSDDDLKGHGAQGQLGGDGSMVGLAAPGRCDPLWENPKAIHVGGQRDRRSSRGRVENIVMERRRAYGTQSGRS